MRQSLAWVMMAGISGAMLGCHAESTKDANGGDRVKVSTPFGGLQVKVKTNEDAAESGTGVPIYPGATLVRKGGKNSDNGTADINLSFGSMRLRVEVLSYQTTDGTDQVRSFYAKELGRFGTVIACVDERAVGTPTRTPEGLTCDKDSNEKQSGVGGGSESSSVELKAGSPQHQHAVSIEKTGDGTKFALIRIDLPKQFTIGDGSANGEKTQ